MPPVRVGACIGRGRLGSVYEGHSDTVSLAVAVKCVEAEHTSTLKHSWELLQKVRHPNLLRAYAYEEDATGARLVMPLARGSLDTLVMDTRTLARAMRQVAEGLSHLHACGWVHRDIKPKNLLLIGRDVVISDFGLTSEHTPGVPVAPCGTPVYMAPEAFLWQSGPAVDWFALGVTLYELLMDHLPFDGESLQADIVAKQQGRYPRLAGRGLDVWAPMIRGLLNPDPRQRWGAGEILDYLDADCCDVPLIRRASA
ncbi:MAG: serine/threonine-protein kinase [Myxococcota bacterium]